ncbi:hypothetical protein L7F22_010833 [Adiantum nelumboides]|nr:hypothetical protein [Adiantum nelumboides]
MVRRHGWQYPPHTYQVVAIILFFSLAAIFYTFISPFLGHTIKEYVAVVVFSPVALAVSFLYIRCTAIDPSDQGVLATDGPRAAEQSCSHKSSQLTSNKELQQSNKIGLTRRSTLLYAVSCRGKALFLLRGISFYVTSVYLHLQVHKFSKHCRSCDKCVEGFDHHCRWLNNCIGRKNYVSFVALMAACLIMLFVETIAGLIVLVRCFTDKHEIRTHLTSKLGNGFSIAPFSAFVALCTLAPLLASIPLGELFCFHMLLIRKGITTYEYVVAMRIKNEPPKLPQVEKQNIPVQHVTGWRNPNSVGVLNIGDWCTSRRQQQQGQDLLRAEPRKLPCTVGTESTTVVEKTGYRPSRNVVKISALKLAMLNPKEAANAATKVRENSSILRPVGFSSFRTSDTDCGSSCNITPRSSISLEYGPASGRKGLRKEEESLMQTNASLRQEMPEEENDGDIVSSRSRSPVSTPLSPLPVERKFGNPNILRTSVQDIQLKDVGAGRHGLQLCDATILPQSSIEHPSWICTTPLNEGREPSRGSETVQLGRSHIISVERHANGEKCDSSRTNVYWDRAAGRFRSLPKSTSSLLPKTTSNDALDLSGPHSILSPGRCLVNGKSASLGGPLISSTPKNLGKENVLKMASNSSSFSMHRHIVLPSQGINRSPTFVYRSSLPACGTKLMLSRFTSS